MRFFFSKFFNSLNITIYKVFKKSVKHHKISIVLYLTFFLFFSFHLSQIQYSIDPSHFFSSQSISKANWNKYVDLFGKSESLAIIWKRSDNLELTEPDLCELVQWQSQFENRVKNYKQLISPFDIKQYRIKNNKISTKKLLPLNCQLGTVANKKITLLSEVVFRDLFLSKKKNELLFAVEVRDEADISLLIEHIEKFNSSFLGSFEKKFEYKVLGAKAAFWHINKAIIKDNVVNNLVIVPLLLTLFLFFRSLSVLFSALFVVISLKVFIYGLMSFVGQDLDMVNGGMFLFIVISSIQDIVFIYCGYKKTRNWKSAFRQTLLPSFYTSLTTFFGFISLCLAPLPVVQKVGFWCALGALFQWVVTFLFLPAILSVLTSLQKMVKMSRIKTSINKKRRIGGFKVKALYLVPILALFSFTFVDSESELLAFFPKDHQFRKDMIDFEDSFGWTLQARFVYEKSDEASLAIVDELIKDPLVYSLYDRKKVSQQLFKYDQVMDIEDLSAEIGYASEMYLPSSKEWDQSLLLLKGRNLHQIDLFQKKIVRQCRGVRCFITGEIFSLVELAQKLSSSLIRSLIGSVGLVSLCLVFLCFLLNRKRQVVLLLLSSFWGPFTALGLFYILGFNINFVSSIFISIIVGLSGDNLIHFLFKSKNRNIIYGISEKKYASQVSTLAILSCTPVFLFSSFVPPQQLGVLMFFSFIINFFGDIFVTHWTIGLAGKHD